MSVIHEQLRARRRELNLQQSDMPLRIGMARQQYNRLENGGNSSLKILELAAAGLDSTLMLIPKEKLRAVREVLARPFDGAAGDVAVPPENPWSDLLAASDE
jgi:HTH-type transcriptional regulator / antitoxin HipB